MFLVAGFCQTTCNVLSTVPRRVESEATSSGNLPPNDANFGRAAAKTRAEGPKHLTADPSESRQQSDPPVQSAHIQVLAAS